MIVAHCTARLVVQELVTPFSEARQEHSCQLVTD